MPDRPLTYEDGYREGKAARRSTDLENARAIVQASQRLHEAPSRTSLLLEAIAVALIYIAEGDEQ